MNKQIQDIDLFIMDLDGTIYLGNKIIDGSLDFVNMLKKYVEFIVGFKRQSAV